MTLTVGLLHGSTFLVQSYSCSLRVFYRTLVVLIVVVKRHLLNLTFDDNNWLQHRHQRFTGGRLALWYHVYGSLWRAKIIEKNNVIVTREAGFSVLTGRPVNRQLVMMFMVADKFSFLYLPFGTRELFIAYKVNIFARPYNSIVDYLSLFFVSAYNSNSDYLSLFFVSAYNSNGDYLSLFFREGL